MSYAGLNQEEQRSCFFSVADFGFFPVRRSVFFSLLHLSLPHLFFCLCGYFSILLPVPYSSLFCSLLCCSSLFLCSLLHCFCCAFCSHLWRSSQILSLPAPHFCVFSYLCHSSMTPSVLPLPCQPYCDFYSCHCHSSMTLSHPLCPFHVASVYVSRFALRFWTLGLPFFYHSSHLTSFYSCLIYSFLFPPCSCSSFPLLCAEWNSYLDWRK